ncbi:hypothetical protein HMPREF9413_5230 [Paenibacillus sp. HGF7]|nr:hypothetical protein HMPREF9413_5230 [Paenibacillus sp. HGF7]
MLQGGGGPPEAPAAPLAADSGAPLAGSRTGRRFCRWGNPFSRKINKTLKSILTMVVLFAATAGLLWLLR